MYTHVQLYIPEKYRIECFIYMFVFYLNDVTLYLVLYNMIFLFTITIEI